MTTTISEVVASVDGAQDNRRWIFFTNSIRESGDGTQIITTTKVPKTPVNGVLTVELDPGPAVVVAPDGKAYNFVVPESDSELWPLIQAAVTIPPSTTHQQLVDAVDAWLDVNAHLWDSISDKPAPLAAGANVANGYAGLDGTGKIGTAQLPLSAMEYKGAWNASTNSPTLADGSGNTGDFYRVSTGATRNLGSGSIVFAAGDDVLYNGSTWEKAGGGGYAPGGTDVAVADGGTGASTADAARTNLSAERARTVNVLDSGADNTGATGDLGAIITSLAAALHTAGGGTIAVPVGTYKFTTTGTIDSPKVNLVCAGSGATKFAPASGLGTAACLDISGITTSSGDYAGKFGGFFIDGTSAPSGVGLAYGDLVRGHLDDIFIDNYPQGTLLRFVNRAVWTERTLLTRVTLGDNAKIKWAFEVAGGSESFGYTRALDCALNLAPVTATTTVASVTTTAGSTSATVASGGFPSVTTNMSVDGTNLHGGTTVSAVASNTLTLSIPAKASGTATLSFAANNQTGIYVGPGAYLYNGTLNLIANCVGGTAGTNQSPVLCKVDDAAYVEYMDWGIDAESPAGAGKITALSVGAASTFIGWGYTTLGPTPWANTNYVSATAAAVRLSELAHWGFLANPTTPASSYAITDGNLKMFRGRFYNEAYDRLQFDNDGSIYLGDGTATPDVHVSRFGANGLNVDSRFRTGEFKSLQTGATNSSYDSKVSGDANDRLTIDASGKHSWGDGTAAADTTLYRSAADTLKTDDNLIVAAPGSAAGSVLTNQSAVSGLVVPVRVAAETGLTYTIASGSVTQIAGTTIDGVSVAVGDRIAVLGAPAATGAGSGQSAQPGNGVYTVTGNTTNITVARAPEMSGSVNPYGMGVFIREGSTWPSWIVFFNNGTGAFTWGTTTLQYTHYFTPANLVYRTDAQTITGKRITPRVNTVNAPGATPTLAWDSYDQINLTGINAAITSLSSGITGTPTAGQRGVLRFKDDGTGRAITAGASWRAIGVTLSTTTVANKTLYWFWVYNSTDSKYDVYDVKIEA